MTVYKEKGKAQKENRVIKLHANSKFWSQCFSELDSRYDLLFAFYKESCIGKECSEHCLFFEQEWFFRNLSIRRQRHFAVVVVVLT